MGTGRTDEFRKDAVRIALTTSCAAQRPHPPLRLIKWPRWDDPNWAVLHKKGRSWPGPPPYKRKPMMQLEAKVIRPADRVYTVDTKYLPLVS